MRRQFVIAHYDEALDWLEDLPPACSRIVYHKHHSARENRLPNIGREAHTYLHHILTHYDRLADLTVFLQGRPLDHILSDDIELKVVFEQIPSDVGYFDLGTTPLIEDRTGSPSHHGLDLSGVYQKLFAIDPPEFFCCRAGANVAVSRETIQQHSRVEYERFQKLLLESPKGAWEFERMWPYLFKSASARQGIVTAADAGFFGELRWMLLSLRQVSDVPVEVFDVGLTVQQRAWIGELKNCRLRPLPTLVNRLDRIQKCRMWQTWLKPIYLLMSDFDECLWIDADCVVLKDLTGLFDSIQSGPLLCPDLTDAEVENRPKLYDWLPVGEVPLNSSLRVNAGTIGLDKRRDQELLAAWAWAVQFAARNLRLTPLFRWFDQGALHWAIHRLAKENLVSPESRWCVPFLEDINIISDTIRNYRSLTGTLRRRFPDTSIVHFLGKSKLSRQLTQSFEV